MVPDDFSKREAPRRLPKIAKTSVKHGVFETRCPKTRANAGDPDAKISIDIYVYIYICIYTIAMLGTRHRGKSIAVRGGSVIVLDVCQ